MDRINLIFALTGFLIGIASGMIVMAFIMFKKYPALLAAVRAIDTLDIKDIKEGFKSQK